MPPSSLMLQGHTRANSAASFATIVGQQPIPDQLLLNFGTLSVLNLTLKHTHHMYSGPLAIKGSLRAIPSLLCSVEDRATEQVKPKPLHLGISEAEHDSTDSPSTIRPGNQAQVYVVCAISADQSHSLAPGEGACRPVEIPQQASKLLIVRLAARFECPESWNSCWLGCKLVNTQLPAQTVNLRYLPTLSYGKLSAVKQETNSHFMLIPKDTSCTQNVAKHGTRSL